MDHPLATESVEPSAAMAVDSAPFSDLDAANYSEPASAAPPAVAVQDEDALLAAELSNRRRSGRVRQEPQQFMPETPKSRNAIKRKPKRPTQIVKIRYANLHPLPTLLPITHECTREVFWLRVLLREFLLRFDKLCRLPTRHVATINDPLTPWNDSLYKAAIVALLRLVQNDASPIFSFIRPYLADIEATPAESPELWTMLYEFLTRSDAYVAKSDELTGEHYRLELVRRLMVLITGTETIRLTVASDYDQLRALHNDHGEELKKIDQQLADSIKRLDKFKNSDKEAYKERVAAAKKLHVERLYRAEQSLHTQNRKYTLRTVELGQDSYGNSYWSLQQKSRDIPSWGTWIICEMVWTSENLEKRAKILKSLVTHASKQTKRKRKKEEPISLKLPLPKPPSPTPMHLDDPASSVVPAVPSKSPAQSPVHVSVSPLPTPKPEPVSELSSSPFEAPAISENSKATSLEPPAASTSQQTNPATSGKKRKPKLPVKLKEPELFYVEGTEQIQQLAAWIKGQPGCPSNNLVNELENVAYFMLK